MQLRCMEVLRVARRAPKGDGHRDCAHAFGRVVVITDGTVPGNAMLREVDAADA